MHNHKNKTCYDILKIHPSATDEDVREAYLALAQIYHPDKNPDKKTMALSRFKMVREAYDILKTAECRKQYNRILRGKNIRINHLKADNDNQSPNAKPAFWNQWLGLRRPIKSEFHSDKPSSNGL